MAGYFRNAVNAAGISITTNKSGSRTIGGNAHMDREDDQQFKQYNNYRGRSRGRSRGRAGGRYNSYRPGVTPMSRYADDRDEEGDEVMGGGFRAKPRFKPYGNRGNYGRGGYNQNRFDDKRTFNSKWFKITIPGGRQHDKNWLITKLTNQVTLPFECVEFHYTGDSACFFVEDKEVADALKSKSHRITVRDGSKIVIHVRPSDPPRFSRGADREGAQNAPPARPVDPETEQVLMNCLAQRFLPDTNSINLSKLADDATLSSSNVQGNLSKPWLMSAFIDIIHKIQPALDGLDLSSNQIRNLDILRRIHEKLPSLKIISLKDNEIQSVEDLERLKPIESLKHLLVEGNPFCAKYQNNLESLLRDVQSKLPNLEILDGVKLPPPISFDVPTKVSLPPSKTNFLQNSAMQSKITQFIQEYFQVYDRDDRQGLLDFYHDQANFSLCVNTNVYSKDYGRERQQPLNEYFQFSRNLKRLRDKAKRSSLIKHTKLATVAFLTELPKSKHDLSSFALDVSMETGVATETAPVEQPKGVTPLTSQQEELVKKFSEASKMNLDFSLKCLQQNNWDFQKSGEVFTKLQQQGQIPPEAFKH
eukprot:gene2767-989_t